jgi:hypothetical protein
MPLSYSNRSRVLIAPRGVVAFPAQDGSKLVCCLVGTAMLEDYFAGSSDHDACQIFDRYRDLVEVAASIRYDAHGSDECGELIVGDGDLRRSEATRLAQALGADHRWALSLAASRQELSLPSPYDPSRIRIRTIPW